MKTLNTIAAIFPDKVRVMTLSCCAALVLAMSQCSLPCFAQSQTTDSTDRGKKASATESKEKPVFLQGSVDAFGVLTDEIQGQIGIQCRKASGQTSIATVRPNSLAALNGLRAGDAVLDASIDKNSIFIKINRDGNTYGARIALNGASQTLTPSAALNTIRQTLDTSQFKLRTETTLALSKYKLELIIDRSLTMRKRDCPGGLSRWDWCAYQTEDLSKALAKLAPEGIAITRFAADFDTLENAGPQAVSSTLWRHDFQRGTCLAEPLDARINNYFARRKPGDKPLLIAVITDGCPAPRPEPMMVRQVLLNASKIIRQPGDLAIVFLQIGGDDIGGQNYLLSLSSDRRFSGAGRQFVFTKTFEELLQIGLAQGLLDAVKQTQFNYANNSRIGSSSYSIIW
jgi:hypothetical protein